jgi:putative protease
VRVQKPGEEGYDRRFAALEPDGLLVRHWGALVHFQEQRARASSAQHDSSRSNNTQQSNAQLNSSRQRGSEQNNTERDSAEHDGAENHDTAHDSTKRDSSEHDSAQTDSSAQHGARPLTLHGDFSLNVTNSITAAELFARGLDTLTPSHDLDRAQLAALLDASDASRFTAVLQHRIPTFHTEHCVYAHLLSHGRDFRTCGRPCEKHAVALKDMQGREHPVIVDVGCRNTVFNSEVQSAAEFASELVLRGVRRFRVEFVRETRREAVTVLTAYRDLLANRISPRVALERAAASSRVGVSDAAMAVME